jgi:hypothetical protein
MENFANDLKTLFTEIPVTSNEGSHEKLKCILVLYSGVLARVPHVFRIADYFSNLHIMSFDIKSILNRHVNAATKHATFERTRNMLIRDIYHLVKMTETVSNSPAETQFTALQHSA